MLRSLRTFLRTRNKNIFLKRGIVAASFITAGSTIFAATTFLDVESSNELYATFGAGVRFIRTVKIGLGISMDYYISGLGLTPGTPNYEAMMSLIHTRSAESILNGCLVNGGTYIKIGQGIVSCSHIVPLEYCNTLAQLQDKCLTREEGEVQKLFCKDFEKEPEELFKTFNPEPIAAASLAQVYKATTKDNEEVAVKVQYIDLQSRFISDVATINFLLSIVGVIHPNFNFAWIMTDLVDSLRGELDFIKEGQNSERCAKDLKHLNFVYVPKVYWELTSKRVLVTEYVEAIKINDVKKLKENGFFLTDVNLKLFTAFGEQIFETGFVHGDPHPGNVLVRMVNKEAQLVLLDHGLYQLVSDDTRINLSHFWKALVLQDHKSMKKYSDKLGVSDYVMLAEILTQRPLKSRNFKLKKNLTENDLKYMSDFAQKRFDLIMNTLYALPRSLLFVIRNLNTIRAIAHDHGDPIDRYAVLARAATKTAFRSQKGFLKRLYSIPTRIIFEYQLLMNRLWIWSIRQCFTILYFLGRSPDPSALLDKLT